MKARKLYKFYLPLISAGVLIVIIVGIFYFFKQRSTQAVTEPVSVPLSASTLFSQFDGSPVSSTSEIMPIVLGMMIDNHPDARPQFGIAQARVVYEVPVEGGLTRYFALFAKDQSVAKVGPVRSARAYFLDWLAEYGDSAYWHCGGSPEALDLIKQYQVWDINQFFWDPYFWRAADRDAPHNLFTSSDKWQRYFAGTSHSQTTTWQGWLFGSTLPTSIVTQPISQTTINYQTNYVVRWVYNTITRRYVRQVNGSVYRDGDGAPVQADTVIVQTTNESVIDEEGRRHIDTVGQGDARIFRNGLMIRGTWKKADRTSRTRFYDAQNQEIPLQGGQIWVQVIPADVEVDVAS